MFSDEQKAALAAKLDPAHVKGREQGGREVSYIESWHAIAEANRIFGFDGWSSETVEIKCVSERERTIGRGQYQKQGWGVTYTAKLRIVAGGVTREGVGAGHGIDADLGQAHESAIKEAESDARKRALMSFGNPFGLALYDKSRENVGSDSGDGPQPPPVMKKQDTFVPNAAQRAAAAPPTVAQVGTYRERVAWLKGAKTPEDLKARAKNPEHLAEVAKLTESQKSDLRNFYLDHSAALIRALLQAG